MRLSIYIIRQSQSLSRGYEIPQILNSLISTYFYIDYSTGNSYAYLNLWEERLWVFSFTAHMRLFKGCLFYYTTMCVSPRAYLVCIANESGASPKTRLGQPINNSTLKRYTSQKKNIQNISKILDFGEVCNSQNSSPTYAYARRKWRWYHNMLFNCAILITQYFESTFVLLTPLNNNIDSALYHKRKL